MIKLIFVHDAITIRTYKMSNLMLSDIMYIFVHYNPQSGIYRTDNFEINDDVDYEFRNKCLNEHGFEIKESERALISGTFSNETTFRLNLSIINGLFIYDVTVL